MADQIERYLGRLEAELDGKTENDQIELIVLEVESHLRESEQAYVELGEPVEVANRLAVEGFSGLAEFQPFLSQSGNRFLPVSVINRIAQISAFTLISGAVLTSTIISNINIAFPLVIGSAALVAITAYLGRQKAVRQILVGGVWAAACLIALFGMFGRVASLNSGFPRMGLLVGNETVMTAGNPVAVAAARDQLRQWLLIATEANAFQGAAKLESGRFFASSRIRSDGKFLQVNTYDSGFGYTYTPDSEAALESWRVHGDKFMINLQSTVSSSERQLEFARQMTSSQWLERIPKLFVALCIYIGSAGILLGMSLFIGIGLRRIGGFAQKLNRKGWINGFSK